MTVSEPVAALVRSATRTKLDDIPTAVVDGVRLLLLDTVGALAGGMRYPAVSAIARALATVEPTGPNDVPFRRLLVLGTAATWLDADSGGAFHPEGARVPPVPTAHPGPHVLPVLLHAAATNDLTDFRALKVFLVATEIGLRAGMATSLRPGLHPHGVHGPGAAAIAAALLRGSAEEEVGRAFVLGSSLPMAATLALPVAGGTARNLWTGLGAYYGACAAAWAAAGSSPGPATFEALFDGAVCTDLSYDRLAGDLGSRWEVVNSYLKPYACARWIHPALDAVARATADAGVLGSDVAAVEVDTFAFAASLDAVIVRSDMQARFSLPWCVATLLLDQGLWAESFLPERLAHPAIAELAARVVVREDPSATAALPAERPAAVVVHTHDGRRLSAQVRNARGNPSSALSRAEVEQKFRRNAAEVLPAQLADDLVTALLDDQRLSGHALAAVARHLVGALSDDSAQGSTAELDG